MPVLKSLKESLIRTSSTLIFIFKSLFYLIINAPLKPEVLKSLVGPIGVVSMAAQASAIGFVYFLQLISLISLNLAALNIFPFPALDGGRLILILIEKIKGSPLPAKTEQAINSAGFALLITAMLLITLRDLSKFF